MLHQLENIYQVLKGTEHLTEQLTDLAGHKGGAFQRLSVPYL
jgi:hypothetical protein